MRYRNFGLLAAGLAAVLLMAPSPVKAADESASAEIDKRAQDPNQWPAPGRDNKLTRFSPLKDINTDNVKKLEFIWSQSMNSLRGQEGQPVVVDADGTPMMFFVSGCPSMALCNWVQALDLSDPDNPKEIWNYVKKTDRDELAIPRACCDTVNRGLNYAKGKVVLHTLDGFIIALDAKTGQELWVVKHAWPERGETHTGPTLIAENLVIGGFGGDEFAARGRLTAYDIETGKMVWSCHSTGSDKDVCLTPDSNKANPHFGTYGKDLGISSYPEGEWKIGGGAPWAWFSYDPELKMVYASTGNPGHWSPGLRCAYTGEDHTHEKCNDGKYDNKWSMTIFGRKVETGEVVFAYQMTPFDQWDYDGVNENILVDLEVDGKPRKVLVHFDRNGFAIHARPHRRHSAPRQQVRDRGLGREGRPQDRPTRQGEGAFALRHWREHSVLPVSHGRQGSAALRCRSRRAEHVLLPHQQLVHGRRAAGAHAHAAGHGLRVRQRVHVSREARHHRQVQEVQRSDR